MFKSLTIFAILVIAAHAHPLVENKEEIREKIHRGEIENASPNPDQKKEIEALAALEAEMESILDKLIKYSIENPDVEDDKVDPAIMALFERMDEIFTGLEANEPAHHSSDSTDGVDNPTTIMSAEVTEATQDDRAARVAREAVNPIEGY